MSCVSVFGNWNALLYSYLKWWLDPPRRINSKYKSVYSVGNCEGREEAKRKEEGDSFPFPRNSGSSGSNIEKVTMLWVILIN